MPWRFSIELPVKHLFLLATVTMSTVKMFFTHFHSSSCRKNIPLSKPCNLLVLTLIEKIKSSRQITEENLSQKLYLVLIAKNNNPSGSKCIKHFMAHQCMPKIFHCPHKNPPAPPPTYLMYGSLSYMMSTMVLSVFQ